MLTNTDPVSESYRAPLPAADVIHRLLASKQYDKIEQLLYHALLTMPPTAPTLFSEILVAARQISLACSICHDQAEWHKWASEEADRHEGELKQVLQVLSDLFNNPGNVPKLEEYTTQLTRTDQVHLNGQAEAQIGKANLWQRIQGLLGLDNLAATAKTTPPFVQVQPEPTPIVEVDALQQNIGRPTDAPSQDTPTPAFKKKTKQSLIIYGLGSFRVYQNGDAIENWPNRKGKSVFRYLILNRQKPVPKEVLMDCFWVDSDADAARNNLNVTIYNLRQTLRKPDPTFSHILFQDDCYIINPDFEIWVDFEAFTENFKKGQSLERMGNKEQAISYYMVAEPLYQGDLFEEDRYDEWVLPYRDSLRENYLALLSSLGIYYLEQRSYTACMAVCNKMIVMDAGREDAHHRLMDCYVQMGQRYLALRQYHTCVEALKRDLDIEPSPTLTQYYQEIMDNLV